MDDSSDEEGKVQPLDAGSSDDDAPSAKPAAPAEQPANLLDDLLGMDSSTPQQ